MNNINCSSVSLSTQSLTFASAFPFCSPVGLLPSNNVLTFPNWLSAFKSSKPFTSTWSLTSLYPFGKSPVRQLLPLLEPPNPDDEPSAAAASFLTTAWSLRGSAPWILSTTLPCSNNMKVGILCPVISMGSQKISSDLWHIRSNAIFGRDLLLCIRVDLDECNVVRTRQLCRKLLVDRCYLLAWSTPICVDCTEVSASSRVHDAKAIRKGSILPGSGGVGGANSQSVTTILEDFKRSANCPGEAICIVFDILSSTENDSGESCCCEVEVGFLTKRL
jgi:hypothetical protein